MFSSTSSSKWSMSFITPATSCVSPRKISDSVPRRSFLQVDQPKAQALQAREREAAHGILPVEVCSLDRGRESTRPALERDCHQGTSVMLVASRIGLRFPALRLWTTEAPVPSLAEKDCKSFFRAAIFGASRIFRCLAQYCHRLSGCTSGNFGAVARLPKEHKGATSGIAKPEVTKRGRTSSHLPICQSARRTQRAQRILHILGAAALGKHSNWCALGTKAAPLYLAPKKTCILTHAMTPSWRCCVASKVPKASLRRNEAPEVSSTPRAKASSKARCRSWRFTDTASQGEKAHF